MNQNFITIDTYLINEALKAGIIEKLGENYRQSGNTYYRLRTSHNTILMRIKEDNYILINETISSNGKTIYLVPILSYMSFHINKTRDKEYFYRERVKGRFVVNGVGKVTTIERIIRSIIINGTVSILPSDFHIHHKDCVFDDREFSTEYIYKELHNDKGRKSHVSGLNIQSLADFNKIGIRKIFEENYYEHII